MADETRTETCPRCGAVYARSLDDARIYDCGSVLVGADLAETEGCLRRQRDALEARAEALAGGLRQVIDDARFGDVDDTANLRVSRMWYDHARKLITTAPQPAATEVCAGCGMREDEGCACCDECDGSGVYYIDGEPQTCICAESQEADPTVTDLWANAQTRAMALLRERSDDEVLQFLRWIRDTPATPQPAATEGFADRLARESFALAQSPDAEPAKSSVRRMLDAQDERARLTQAAVEAARHITNVWRDGRTTTHFGDEGDLDTVDVEAGAYFALRNALAALDGGEA